MATAGAFFVTVLCIIRRYNLRQVQIALPGAVPEVHSYYAIPRVTALAEFRGLPNFTVG